MLPALPTGMQWKSGASPSTSTISNAAGLLALDPVRVDRVDHRHRRPLAELADDGQGLVEVAPDLEHPGAVDEGLGQLAEGDVAVGDEHGAGQAGPGGVGGGRGRGVARGGAHDRLRPLLHRLGDGHGHAPVLERAGRVGPSTLSYTSAPTRSESRGAGSRGVPPSSRVTTGVAAVDRQELPVLLDDAAPAGRRRSWAVARPPGAGRRSAPPRRAGATRARRLHVALAGRVGDEDQPGRRRRLRRSSSCSMDRMDTPWSPSTPATAASTPGRSTTSRSGSSRLAARRSAGCGRVGARVAGAPCRPARL